MSLFDSLRTAYTSQDIKINASLTWDHHIFDNLNEHWLRNPPPKLPPCIILTASVTNDDYCNLVIVSQNPLLQLKFLQ